MTGGEANITNTRASVVGRSRVGVFSTWMPPGGWLWCSPPQACVWVRWFSCCIQVQSEIVSFPNPSLILNTMDSTGPAHADLLSSYWHILQRRRDLGVTSGRGTDQSRDRSSDHGLNTLPSIMLPDVLDYCVSASCGPEGSFFWLHVCSISICAAVT